MASAKKIRIADASPRSTERPIHDRTVFCSTTCLTIAAYDRNGGKMNVRVLVVSQFAKARYSATPFVQAER
jgi:hypothetical protein